MSTLSNRLRILFPAFASAPSAWRLASVCSVRRLSNSGSWLPLVGLSFPFSSQGWSVLAPLEVFCLPLASLLPLHHSGSFSRLCSLAFAWRLCGPFPRLSVVCSCLNRSFLSALRYFPSLRLWHRVTPNRSFNRTAEYGLSRYRNISSAAAG